MNDHDHDLGLLHDLKTIARMRERRNILRWIAGAGLVPLIGCGGSDTATPVNNATGGSSTGGSATAGSTTSSSGGSTTGSTGSSTTGAGTCSKIPEETQGPYPGDGSNGANALALAGIVRSDIRSSLAAMSGSADGVPLTLKLTVVSVNGSCTNLAGYAVYIWHCDRDGLYSLYTISTESYLRGVQETDASGTVTFTTIFPGCYPGRWPHIHFEIYPSLASATSSASRIATSQLALPADACNSAYTASGYATSATNLTRVTLATDMVFADGAVDETPSVTGNATDGFVATLKVAVAA